METLKLLGILAIPFIFWTAMGVVVRITKQKTEYSPPTASCQYVPSGVIVNGEICEFSQLTHRSINGNEAKHIIIKFEDETIFHGDSITYEFTSLFEVVGWL